MDLFDYPDDYKPQKPLTNQEMEEITHYLKNHPLFLNQLPQTFQDNQLIAALQNLKYSDQRDTDAQNLCTEGSNLLKKNSDNIHYLKLAYQKYTEAINLKPSEPKLLAKLHCNRALINLKNKNYGKVIIDCNLCLKYDSDYTKAYYRCAQAFIAAKRYQEALQILANRPEPELSELKDQAEKLKQKLNKIEEDKKKQIDQANDQIVKYCSAKKYNIVKRYQKLPENAKIEFFNGKLSIPILFAYPEFSQMDLIAHTVQQEKVRTYLSQLFESPLPWDQKQEYNSISCELYCELTENKILKVPKQAKIQQIAKRVPIKQALQIIVVAKDNPFSRVYLQGKTVL